MKTRRIELDTRPGVPDYLPGVHEGVIVYNPATDRLAVGTSSAFVDLAADGDAGGDIAAAIADHDGANTHAQIDAHLANVSNPHSVSKSQVGLGNVDNTSDATKNAASATLANKTLTSPTLSGHVRATGAAATITANANAGATASLTGSSGNDRLGEIVLVPGGAGLAAGVQVTVTFAAAMTDATFIVHLSPHSSAARAANAVVGTTGRSTTKFDIIADSALTGGSTYTWFYTVEERV